VARRALSSPPQATSSTSRSRSENSRSQSPCASVPRERFLLLDSLPLEAPLFIDDLLAAAPPDVVLQLEVKATQTRGLARWTVDALAERACGRQRGRRVELLSFATATCARAARDCPARLVVWADHAPAARPPLAAAP
jgi:hypothetical protein